MQKPTAHVATSCRLRSRRVNDASAGGRAPERRARGSGGSQNHNAAAIAAFNSASVRNADCQFTPAATMPEIARPLKPPRIVPVIYAAVARPACDAGQTSWMYAIALAKTPGVATP